MVTDYDFEFFFFYKNTLKTKLILKLVHLGYVRIHIIKVVVNDYGFGIFFKLKPHSLTMVLT